MTFTFDTAYVDTVREIAERAGKAILEVYNSPFAVEHKDDKSPVTEADRRAETLIIDALVNELGSPFPIVAEEEAAAGRLPDLTGGPFWLVDPLDGTKEFIGRRGEFTVNIALIEDGEPILGVVHAPATGLTYWGSPHGAFMSEGGDTRPIACRPVPTKGLIAVASRNHRNPETDAFLAQYDIAEAISSGSSIKFCLVAIGRADLYPRTGRTMEWDTAAGHGVVRYAGGSVTRLDGTPLTYGKPGFDNPHFVVRGAPAAV
ncbi:MAG: 3'(2'),5'-bisphosphate nucleotidase CysQ [Rhodospirillales bacterium]